jgi:LysR family cyn operon transcriptional activator
VELLVQTGIAPVVVNSLSQGALDLALLVSPDLAEGSDIRVEAHWDFEMVLVSRLRQAPRRCRLAELEGFPFILFQKGSRVGEPIDRYFVAHGFRPRVIMRFDAAEPIRAMIRTGLGISMLPMWSVDDDLRQGRLWLIRQAEPPLLSKIALMRRESGHVPQPVQAFIAQAQKAQWKTPRLTSGGVPAEHGPAGASPEVKQG